MSITLAKQALARENQRYGDEFVTMWRHEWPDNAPETLIEVKRNRRFLVQIHQEHDHIRITVNRTKLGADGRWVDGITWDELNEIKNACGFAHRWCVEVFPPKDQLVNDANMRHLWVLDHSPAYGWKR